MKNKLTNISLNFRQETLGTDSEAIRRIIKSTDFFNEEEQEIAVELIDERLQKGKESGYYFLFAENEGEVIGYVCYGPIMGTASSYDLYWIAVENTYQKSGIGKELMKRTEMIIKEIGGGRIYVETSSKDLYIPTRKFYQKSDYIVEAQLKDFYGPNDDKVIFVKVV
ncbi:MAG: GNAT family N-acetyltransferase [Candidatus Margulisbacteria bacterium GWF2_35_9]|nr:MAG: GNAT family N-acetyltransferase [Candidatus Margulisbacteria bacterium GWF2_35_9]